MTYLMPFLKAPIVIFVHFDISKKKINKLPVIPCCLQALMLHVSHDAQLYEHQL